MPRWIGVIAFAAAGAAAMPAEAATCAGSRADRIAIERVVRTFYAGLAKDDWALYSRQLTSDFVAIEAAQYYSARRLFDEIAAAHRQGKTWEWKVGPMTISFDCRSASAHWETRGQSGVPPKLRPRRWMESAVFKRSGTGWKLQLFHSTAAADGE